MTNIHDPATHKIASRIPIEAPRLRQARQSKQLTLEEASQAASINKMTLLRYETGDIRAIAPERLERLASLYNTTPAFLHGLSLEQEFTTKNGLQIVPIHADPPTALGRRLTTCLSLIQDKGDHDM